MAHTLAPSPTRIRVTSPWLDSAGQLPLTGIGPPLTNTVQSIRREISTDSMNLLNHIGCASHHLSGNEASVKNWVLCLSSALWTRSLTSLGKPWPNGRQPAEPVTGGSPHIRNMLRNRFAFDTSQAESNLWVHSIRIVEAEMWVGRLHGRTPKPPYSGGDSPP